MLNITRIFRSLKLSIISVLLVFFSYNSSFCEIPVTTDSRIKTFVYNENEVFHITVNYGYMTSIEFAKNEDINTIAPGNGYAWKFIKDGRRLFIKALEGNTQTNLTIITSKHTYQFELESKNPSDGIDDQLVYVVRFFYPDELLDQPNPKIDMSKFMPASTNAVASKHFNFNYTLSGSYKIPPTKVFDDGISTFMQFPNNNAVIPHIFVVSDAGTEIQASYSRKGEYIVIDGVHSQISVKLGSEEASIYNEQKK